jgi:hypothetical protein
LSTASSIGVPATSIEEQFGHYPTLTMSFILASLPSFMSRFTKDGNSGNFSGKAFILDFCNYNECNFGNASTVPNSLILFSFTFRTSSSGRFFNPFKLFNLFLDRLRLFNLECPAN